MEATVKKSYIIGNPKSQPILGVVIPATRDPIRFFLDNMLHHGDIIPFHFLGQKAVQINHPDLVRYVLMENNKNYRKSKPYIRFESAAGQSLLTSNGDKWRRDRQKLQPMFKKEQLEGYYFQVANEVAEKYKHRWLKLTESGPAKINLSQEMSSITIEIILKLIYGKDNLDDEAVTSLYHSYEVLMDYLKNPRLLPTVDMRKLFYTPDYRRFKKALVHINDVIKVLTEKYKAGLLADKYNMLSLLVEAQKQDPQHFDDRAIRNQAVMMIFAGFETTAASMQWMWHVLDERPDIEALMREEILRHAPSAATGDSSGLTCDTVNNMDYLSAVFKETMRLYPPLWVTGREPIEDDYLGDYKVKKGTMIILPQITMHRHPGWWDRPNAFLPERFLPENEAKIDAGIYFPFSQGPRKCTGFKLVEIEVKTIFTKLLSQFTVTILNKVGNGFDPGISLKPKQLLQVEIRRV